MGEHRICFTPTSNSGRSGWLSTDMPNGGIKLTLDLAIGETSAIESSDKGKLQDIASRVSDLSARLQDIRREQVFQRVRTSSPPPRRGGRGVLFSLTRGTTGARGRVQRPVRIDQRARDPLDSDPARRPRRHLRVAAVASAVLLHQTEAHVVSSRLGWGTFGGRLANGTKGGWPVNGLTMGLETGYSPEGSCQNDMAVA